VFKKRSWRFWSSLLGLLAVGIGVGWILATAIHVNSQSNSSSTTKITPPPDQTVTATIPADTTNPARKVGVTIPGAILEKLGPPPGTSLAKIFENVWPGVSTLLGVLAGGGVTLLANLQKNSQERRASNDARIRSIKDRSFNACVDVLKAGRLVTAEAGSLTVRLYSEESHDRIRKQTIPFESARRNYFAAGVVADLALPPAATGALRSYAGVLATYLNHVQHWQEVYLAGKASNAEARKALNDKCDRLLAKVPDKRDQLLEIAKTQFNEGTWSQA
jgi:hypothetical protein